MTSTYQICSTFKKHSIVVRVLKAQPGVGAILVSLPYNNVYLKCQIDVGILKKNYRKVYFFTHIRQYFPTFHFSSLVCTFVMLLCEFLDFTALCSCTISYEISYEKK